MTRVMTMGPVRSISKSQLKAHMLEFFRELEATGQEAIVTDRGQPVLRITPIRRGRTVEEVFARWRPGLVFHEDPDTPTTGEWDL